MFFFLKSIQTPLTFHRSVAISFSDKVELNLENIFYCLPPILVKRRNLKKNRWKVYTAKQVWFFARFPLFLSNKAVVKITKNSMGKECWAIKVRKKLGRKRGSSTWFKPALIRASYSPSMTMLEETAEGRGSRAAWHSLPADNVNAKFTCGFATTEHGLLFVNLIIACSTSCRSHHPASFMTPTTVYICV
jgi:hypothetical protein